eukprot:766750-Hanusia_phi.AAC.1
MPLDQFETLLPCVDAVIRTSIMDHFAYAGTMIILPKFLPRPDFLSCSKSIASNSIKRHVLSHKIVVSRDIAITAR